MKNFLKCGLVFLVSVVLLYSFTPSPKPSAGTAVISLVSDENAPDTNITRFGGSTSVNNPTNRDNTGRSMTFRYFTATDATGADTVVVYPRAYQTLIQYTATDSLAFQVTNLGQSYIGDQITFMVLNSSGSGHQIKFIGTNWAFGSGGAAATLTTLKRANISFIFDGLVWLEQSRVVQ